MKLVPTTLISTHWCVEQHSSIPSFIEMAKYQVTIQFEIHEEFKDLIPPHRTYINYLINKGIIDHYAVSMKRFGKRCHH